MAKAKPNSLFDSVSGKINKAEETVTRTRYGVTEAYSCNSEGRGPLTMAQLESSSNFGLASTCASIINKDPNLKAPFLALYQKQSRNARSKPANRFKARKPVSRTTASGNQSRPYSGTPQNLYRFIVSTLTSNPALLADYKARLFPEL